MAQIFASERSNASAPAAKAATPARNTVPEQTLAGLQARADHSGATTRLTQLQKMESAPLQRLEDEEMLQCKMIQRVEDDEEMLQGQMIQRVEDEEELMQGKAAGNALQRQESAASPGGGTGGMPGNLRQGIESLSGRDMSDVNVHYNSSAPAQVGAHAFAQGRDIHLASGQERHLPHEAWHVVQQQEGRVAPTTDVGGTPVNDDPGLEREADVMGQKASQLASRDDYGSV
jgi:hypothetical protein